MAWSGSNLRAVAGLRRIRTSLGECRRTRYDHVVTVPVFRRESMLEILAFIAHELAAGAAELAFCVLDPDLGRGRYAGEHVEHAGERHVHRPLRAWLDLAERLELRLRTPVADHDGLIRLRFERLDRDKRWQADHDVAPAARERYGAASGYARIAKLEDPGF